MSATVENRVVAVSTLRLFFAPLAEEKIIYVENFTLCPKTDGGRLGLWRIHQIQDKAC